MCFALVAVNSIVKPIFASNNKLQNARNLFQFPYGSPASNLSNGLMKPLARFLFFGKMPVVLCFEKPHFLTKPTKEKNLWSCVMIMGILLFRPLCLIEIVLHTASKFLVQCLNAREYYSAVITNIKFINRFFILKNVRFNFIRNAIFPV